MRFLKFGLTVAAAAFLACAHAYAAGQIMTAKEDYIHTPLPPGFQVVVTELEGPVFADAQGHTFYKWPKSPLRNGDAGEIENKPTCDNHVYRENAGLMSPYPGGFEMPEVDTRPSCTDIWPPVLASTDAKPVGLWTVVERPDGRKQWAYDGWSLYTSILDKRPGDVVGGSDMFHNGEVGAGRRPVGPKPNVPAQFAVETKMAGRLVTLRDQWSVYSFEGDGRNKSNCVGACLDGWAPILAAEYARPVGEWTTFERSPGIYQWAFRGKPLYRHVDDSKISSFDGSDVPRWHNVFTQVAPQPPKGFTMKDTMVGVVLGDSQGKTIYRYACLDDAIDQLPCDYPEAPQVYRFTVCGGGDPAQCLKTFPYVIAPAGAQSSNTVWGTMFIDPISGKRATAGQPGALYVWTFRGRPIYTFAGSRGYADKKPSDINGHDWGEWNGQRNGFSAMVYRDIYSNRDG